MSRTHLPLRLLRPAQCLRSPKARSLPQRFALHSRPSPYTRNTSTSPHQFSQPIDELTLQRTQALERAYYTRRSYYAAGGALFCLFCTIVLISTIDLPPKPEKCDAPPPPSPKPHSQYGRSEKNAPLVQEAGTDIEQIPTGTSSVPFFPKTLTLPSSSPTASPTLPAGIGASAPEYQLLGLGIRTVSFLSIQVYVVGLYIATPDIPRLQNMLVKKITGSETASTLVATETEALRKMLLDADGSEEVWDEILREAGVRSVLRIVPTRGTDFSHLRDGWVRGISARAKGDGFEDEGFGEAIGTFKGLFGKRGLGKGKALLLGRERGVLSALVEEREGMVRLGEVRDERVGRLVWLGYLAGNKVASEGARRSVVEGVIELVERPVGTVETKVE